MCLVLKSVQKMGYFMDIKGYFYGYLRSKHGLSFISTKGYLRSLKKTFPVRASTNATRNNVRELIIERNIPTNAKRKKSSWAISNVIRSTPHGTICSSIFENFETLACSKFSNFIYTITKFNYFTNC